MKRSRGLAVLLLSLIFVVGGLTGMAVEEATGIDWFEFLDADAENQDDPTQLMAGISLTAEQKSKIDEILDTQEDRLEDYWEPRMPEIKTIVAGSYSEIRALLTPDQRSLFDRRVKDLDGRIPEEFKD